MPAPDDNLRAELLAMRDEDQQLRRQAQADRTLWPAVAEADRRHTARLARIVAAHGWPGRSLAGVDGAEAAWLVAQHADHDRAFQLECLRLLAAAAAAGEAEPAEHAALYRRLARPPRFTGQPGD